MSEVSNNLLRSEIFTNASIDQRSPDRQTRKSMKIKIIFALIAFLTALSALNWIAFQILLFWQLSILTSQLGIWFALVVALCLIAIMKCEKKGWLKTIFICMGCCAIISYLAPLLAVMLRESNWQTALDQNFGARANPHPLWSLSTELLGRHEKSISPVRELNFTGVATGQKLNMDFYAPTQTPAHARAPWVLVIHGGGWDSGNLEEFPELNSHLSSEGYAVFSIDYSLAPQARWPQTKQDVLRAIDVIRAHAESWNIDPARWALLGRSAGGQIAGAVAYSFEASSRPAGLISIYAPSDLIFGYDLGAEDDILKSRGLIRAFLGGTPRDVSEIYRTASMMELAKADSCPTLLLHGGMDNLVAIQHTERMIDRLRHLGVQSAAIIFPLAPHGYDYFIDGPDGQVEKNAIDQFLERILPLK